MKKRNKKKQNWPLHLRPLWPERCALNHPRATGLIDLRTMTTRPTTSTNTARWRTTPTRPHTRAHAHTTHAIHPSSQTKPRPRTRHPSVLVQRHSFHQGAPRGRGPRRAHRDSEHLLGTVQEKRQELLVSGTTVVPRSDEHHQQLASIKLLKVFQLLCPLEPRLPAKIFEPLTNFLNTTKALSVEFESIRCTVRVMPEGTALMAIDMEKLQNFLNSSDRLLICTEKSWIKLSSKTSLLCRTCRRRCSRACRNAG